MRGIATLSECAPATEEPNVLAIVAYRSDGSVETVGIKRSSTKDCAVVECVRTHLQKTKAPPSKAFLRWVGADFTVRRNPPPNGTEKIRWDSWSETKTCTDDFIAANPQINPNVVQQTVRAQFGRFRECYGAGLARDPNLRGKVGLRFRIEPSGKVSEVVVIDNQLPDCEVVGCLKTQMRALEFPKADRPSNIVYPLLLEP